MFVHQLLHCRLTFLVACDGVFASLSIITIWLVWLCMWGIFFTAEMLHPTAIGGVWEQNMYFALHLKDIMVWKYYIVDMQTKNSFLYILNAIKENRNSQDKQYLFLLLNKLFFANLLNWNKGCIHEVLLIISDHNLVFFALVVFRCDCAASGLCIPAVSEGQADQAGVPDSIFPGSLSGGWSCFSLCHLSDIHRLVVPLKTSWQIFQVGFGEPLPTSSSYRPFTSCTGFIEYLNHIFCLCSDSVRFQLLVGPVVQYDMAVMADNRYY